MNTVVRVDAQSSRELVELKIRAKYSVTRACYEGYEPLGGVDVHQAGNCEAWIGDDRMG